MSFNEHCFNITIKTKLNVLLAYDLFSIFLFEIIQSELKMIKISKDPEKVPEWLKCKKTMIPDFVAEDPKVCINKLKQLVA